jgi:predicted amidohydrolase YtcJ
MLVFSAADFEDFREPRPDMPSSMEGDLESVVRLLSEKRWPFRIHATYDETIGRALDVFEKVNRDIPFNGLHWFIDHAETIRTRNIERIKALGGGIAVQHRMAYQGEYFVQRYGSNAAKLSPPIRQMLSMDLPVGAGTDATRVASYNPWICLYWLVTGKTVGGMRLYDHANLLEREEALRRWTVANTWFSNEEGARGQLKEGQLADFIVLSDDFFAIDSEKIKDITSVLTVVGGKPVHAESEFGKLNPPMPEAMPDWSPIRQFGGYQKSAQEGLAAREIAHFHHDSCHHSPLTEWNLGCGCWAF